MPVNGVLILDKPIGMTSHDVVNRVRRKLGTRRVGHAGTLDPDASGLLVLCVGEATRLLEFIVAEAKAYSGSIRFGIGTDTDDATGKEVSRLEPDGLSLAKVTEAARGFVGVQRQQVPAFSAVHINGRRAYEYAREQRQVELPVRTVHIYSLEVLSFYPGLFPAADFTVACSKGTYIRSLCRDWGTRLGVPAHLQNLRRTQSGSFHLDEAISLQDFEDLDEPEGRLLPAIEAIRDLPKVTQNLNVIQRLASGQQVRVDDALGLNSIAAVTSPEGSLVAIVQVLQQSETPGQAVLKPNKVFWKREP